MKRFIWYWGISAIGLYLVTISPFMPGVKFTEWYNAFWVAPLLGLINAVVGGVSGLVSLVAFPVNLMTLGCFGFVLSFVLYTLAVYLLGRDGGPIHAAFSVKSFLDALWLSVVMGLFSVVLNMVLPRKSKRRQE